MKENYNSIINLTVTRTVKHIKDVFKIKYKVMKKYINMWSWWTVGQSNLCKHCLNWKNDLSMNVGNIYFIVLTKIQLFNDSLHF